MIHRLYVHNFRCLENFSFPVSGEPSTLLIGKNGAGKTTVGNALGVLQRIARGTNRVGEVISATDVTRGQSEVPVRFEMEVVLNQTRYEYAIAFELPPNFRELRVLEERLSADGRPIYSRELAQVNLARAGQQPEARFRIDWHLVALPIVQEHSSNDPLLIFKRWLSRILILRPIPSLITGYSDQETLQPDVTVRNFGDWLSGLLAERPSSYTKIDDYLKQVMPDFKEVINQRIGKDTKSLEVRFSNEKGSFALPFGDLSDGEKCFMICALVLASNEVYGPLLCFWDEPDNYLAPSEVGQFVLALRNAFQMGGQFIATSHNEEAIRRFSGQNTLYLYRKSHLEPTIVRSVEDLQPKGDLVGALIRDDLEP